MRSYLVMALALTCTQVGCGGRRSGGQVRVPESDIIESYGQATTLGHTASGLHDVDDTFNSGALQCSATLVPPAVTTNSQLNGTTFLSVLKTAYPTAAGWSYPGDPLPTPIASASLQILTYDVRGTPLDVGAEVQVLYQPRGTDPTSNIHWIQVVNSNHRLTAGGHGVTERKVDTAGVRSTPYYDDGGAAQGGTCTSGCSFYDFSRRADPTQSHDWSAELRLVQGPAVGAGPGVIQVLRPGLRWGWKTRCVAAAVSPALFQANIAGNGGLQTMGNWQAGVTLTLIDPVPFTTSLGGQEGEATLDVLILDMVAGGANQNRAPLTPEAEVVEYQLQQSQGLFNRVQRIEPGPAPLPFTVEGGSAVWHPGSGDVAIEANVAFDRQRGLESGGILRIYGTLDPMTGVLNLGAGTHLIQAGD